MNKARIVKNSVAFLVESATLYFLLQFLVGNFIVPEIREGGDIGFQANLLFIALFISNILLLDVSLLLYAIFQKQLFPSHTANATLGTIIIGVALLFIPLGGVINFLPYRDYLWTLLLVSIPFFILHALLVRWRIL